MNDYLRTTLNKNFNSLHENEKRSILTKENRDSQKSFKYNDNFFKIKEFQSNSRPKSLDFSQKQYLTKSNKGFFLKKNDPSSQYNIIPKQNKVNLLFIQNLKDSINEKLINFNKTQSVNNSNFFSRFQKEKQVIADKFSREKENLKRFLLKEKRRSTIVKENEDEFYTKLQNLNTKFLNIHSNLKEGKIKDHSQFVSYLEFHSDSKNKEYLLSKNRGDIEKEISKYYQEFHQSKGRTFKNLPEKKN